MASPISSDEPTADAGAETTVELPRGEVTIEPGKAYQSVAQSSAIAIQDAADQLRNVNAVSATVMGVAIAQSIAQPSPGDHPQVPAAVTEKVESARGEDQGSPDES